MRLIGISGRAGSGKDTAAKILCEEADLAKVSIADPMKEFCEEMFGFTEEQLWGSTEKRNQPDYRYPRTEHARAWLHLGRPDMICGTDHDLWVRAIFATFGEDAPTHFLTPRDALQKLGDWGRECFPDVWINACLERARAEMDNPFVQPNGVCIPDVRMPNEKLGIEAAGGTTWRIVRPGGSRLTGEAARHNSERSLTDQDVFDRVISNDASLGEFEETILQAVHR